MHIDDFKDLISFYDAVDDVTTISTQKVRWGGVTFLNSIMDLMDVALQNKDNDYFHLLTGQDILIKPLSKLYQFFDTHYGEEFIDCGKDLIRQKEKNITPATIANDTTTVKLQEIKTVEQETKRAEERRNAIDDEKMILG